RPAVTKHSDAEHGGRQRGDLHRRRFTLQPDRRLALRDDAGRIEWRRAIELLELLEAARHGCPDNGTLRARMPRLDVAICGGSLVDGTIADIGIAGERIVQIGGEFEAVREVDARGKLVLPGGVDAHVHLSNPPRDASGPVWVDNFTSGSAAALAGG